MRKLLLILMLLIPTAAAAQTAGFNGFCYQGATSALTSGLPSTNKLQGLIPQCTVSVYLTGTVTLATIYKDSSDTPLTNPFKADQLAKWLFYAATGQGYDVVMTGGIPPPASPYSLTLTDLIIGGGGGGGGSFFAYVNGTALKQLGSVNFADSATATFSNPNTNVVQVTANPGLVVQVNGVPISPASPANFVDDSSVTWDFTSGAIHATVPNPLTIKHNDSATGVNQAVLDFNDTTPAPPSGNESVTFQTDTSTGRLSGYIPIPSFTSALVPFVNVPPSSYASEIILPTVGTVTNAGSSATCQAIAGPDSGLITRLAGNPIGSTDCTIVWSGFPTPSNAASIVALKGLVVGSSLGALPSTINQITCTDGTISIPTFFGNPTIPLGTITEAAGAGTPSSFNWSGATCTADDDQTLAGANPHINTYTLIGIIAYYTGTSVAQSGIEVVPPLYYNASVNQLGLSLPYDYSSDTGTVNAYVISIPAIPYQTLAPTGTEVAFLPAHNNTSTAPSLALNGGYAYGITKNGGAALATNDLTTTAIAELRFDGNTWQLQNPQTAVAGTDISGGVLGSVPYQSAPNTTAVSAANTSISTLCFTETGTGSAGAIPTWGSCAGSAATAFSAITASTNTSAAMVVGAGASLDYTSTGVIDANKVFGATIPASATIVGTNSSHQIVDASSATLTNNTSGNAATATLATTATTAVNLASYPTPCSGGQFSQGLSSGSNNCANPAGGGTVTSVGLVLPSGVFAISGSPVTGSGNLIGSFQTQTANLVFAGPSSGSAAAPTFRALVSADLPPTSLASNLAGGALGSIPYQSATNGTSMLPGVTTAGQTFILSEQPGGSLIAPQWLNLGTYLASPPAIGGTAPAAAFFTTINGHNLPANTTMTVAGGTTVLATGKLLMPPITMSGVGSGCTVTFTPTTDMTTVGGWSPGQMLAPLPFGLTSNQINWYLINNTGSNITTAASVTFVVSAKC